MAGLVSSCAFSTSTAVADSVPGVSPLAGDKSIHELLDLVASEVPEFAGVVSAGPSRLNVLIVGGSIAVAEKVQASLAKWVSPTHAAKQIQILPATYSFHQLKEWHDRVTAEIFQLQGVTVNFIEDKANRLSIGVMDTTKYASDVREKLDELDIPQEAVTIIEMQPFVDTDDLRMKHRPMVGGLQLEPHANPGSTCTLGVPAVWAGYTGFMTAAHCNNFGILDFETYGQHTLNHGAGWEVKDSPTFTGGACPSGQVCRWADVEFDRNVSYADVDLGRIAKPSQPPPSSAWAGAKWRVVGELLTLPDDFVTKVGIKTGTTGAFVLDDYANVFRPSGILMLGQALVNWIPVIQGGDSGSPVFMRVGGTQNDVWFMGILWGVDTQSGTAAYSTILDIEKGQELDEVNTCAPPYSC